MYVIYDAFIHLANQVYEKLTGKGKLKDKSISDFSSLFVVR